MHEVHALTDICLLLWLHKPMLEKGLVSPMTMILPVEITVSTRGMPKGSKM